MSSPDNSAPETPTKLRHLTISAVKPVLESILKDYYVDTEKYVHEYTVLDLLRCEDLQGKLLHPVVLVPSRGILTFILLTAPASFFTRVNVKIDELRYFMATSDILDYKTDFAITVKSGTDFLKCRNDFSFEAAGLYGHVVDRNELFVTMISWMEHVSEPAIGDISYSRWLKNKKASRAEGSSKRKVRPPAPRDTKNKNKGTTVPAVKKATNVPAKKKKKRTKAPAHKKKKVTTSPAQKEATIDPVEKESTTSVDVCVEDSNTCEYSPSDDV